MVLADRLLQGHGCAVTLSILHADSDVVVVNKPSGIAVHRGWAHDPPFVMTLLRDQLGQWVYPLHRLDRATSGALAFALSPEAASRLSPAFAAGGVDKRYVAFVRGVPGKERLIDHPLRRDADDTDPQSARTHVRRLRRYKGRYAWVDLRPETGRSHQLRRHLKYISHPIIGDVKYGKGEHNRLFRKEVGLHRLALHAYALTLPDRPPVLAPLTADLHDAFERLGAPPEVLELGT